MLLLTGAALGIWGATAGLDAALGPVIGGAVPDHGAALRICRRYSPADGGHGESRAGQAAGQRQVGASTHP